MDLEQAIGQMGFALEIGQQYDGGAEQFAIFESDCASSIMASGRLHMTRILTRLRIAEIEKCKIHPHR